jgi:Spy/CpxP family protein refolding chaperone
MIGTVAALCAGGIWVKATAAEAAAPRRPLRAQVLEKAREHLGLTEEQISKIKAELSAEKDSLKELVLKLHETRVALREAIQSEKATESAVRAAAAKVGAVQADLAVECFKLYGRIHPILTPEQREKVKQFQGRIDDFIEGAVNRLGERLGSN